MTQDQVRKRGRPRVPAARDEVARATLAVIARVGLERATVRAIAVELGSTTKKVSHHFATKNELMAFVFRAISRAISAEIAPPSAPPREQLASIVNAFLADTPGRSERWRAWLAFIAAAITDSELWLLQERHYERLTLGVAALLRNCDVERGCSPRIDADADARHMLAQLDGLGLHATMRPDIFVPAEQQRLAAGWLAAVLDP